MKGKHSIPEELIKAKAYEIWKVREQNGKGGNPETDWHEAVEYYKKHKQAIFLGRVRELPYWVERRLENVLNWLKSLALLEILQLLGNASILIAAISYIAEEPERRESDVRQAWQVINATSGKPGNGGRREALEFLNSTPRRIPWFWLTWNREALIGLEAPRAYLPEIELPEGMLYEANLKSADLTRANLDFADLEKANLKSADLTGASLKSADLTGANLESAHFFEAILGDKLPILPTPEQIKSACFWEKATFGEELQKQLESSPPVEGVDCSRWK
jgi:hypothetical protein